VGEYIWALRACCLAMRRAGAAGTVVLAAAVSDFYIPDESLPEHKIQSGASSDGSLTMRLEGVPKMLGAVSLPAASASAAAGIAVDDAPWCPDATVVSFKLETDEALLLPKARGAMAKYGVDAVVANILDKRYDECHLVRSDGTEAVIKRDGRALEAPIARAILDLPRQS